MDTPRGPCEPTVHVLTSDGQELPRGQVSRPLLRRVTRQPVRPSGEIGVPAQKPEGLPNPWVRPAKLRWHDACRVAGLIHTLRDRHVQSIQTASTSRLNPGQGRVDHERVAAARHHAPFAFERLMAGWSPQGRLTASASPIEQARPLTRPPRHQCRKARRGRQEKEGKTKGRLCSSVNLCRV